MRKKVDDQIHILIENGVKSRHRSIFVIIGDKSHNQIINLRHLWEKAGKNSGLGILWCYKEKLGLNSHKGMDRKQVKHALQGGRIDHGKDPPFLIFGETAKISYCMYEETERILGNTFSMCILQDFEALTPNNLARTIETVEGGGLILLLVQSLTSFTSLYTMNMEIHERFRTEAPVEVAPRFNERFLLSLASCQACIFVDDELKILPISSHMRSIIPKKVKENAEGLLEAEKSLKDVKEQLNDDLPVGPLVKICSTLDQVKAVLIFLDTILGNNHTTLKGAIALLSARGRGKSAALGLAVAGAVAARYSNIFVTAPSPGNLKTFFEFVLAGLSALGYKEHFDYDVKSASTPFDKAIIRIDIYKENRQTIQYIQPQEHEKLSQVELLIVDEAAAVPLSIVKSLLGPYLVLLSSTDTGYEGTGRSLSQKLLKQLEDQSDIDVKTNDNLPSGRSFMKIELKDSIRYATGDPVEIWLNSLLCLDVMDSIPPIHRFPLPSECDLYYVNRDTLFSFHKDSELFLKRIMALFVSSLYKNSPDDYQLLADAPAHNLFVLLGPVESEKHFPDIFCVLQVCLERKISRESAQRSLGDGREPLGDQIPLKFCQLYHDTVFPSLLGARIVRIATHPNAMKFGYGSKAVELLARYYEGQLTAISEVDEESNVQSTCARSIDTPEKVSPLAENIVPRTELQPLLVHLRDRKPERLHYIGVSFGLTLDLFRFWRKQNFVPFYICPGPNNVTGEHTCMVLRALNTDDIDVSGSKKWCRFTTFYPEFRQKFLHLLTSSFSSMEYKLAMSILDHKVHFTETESSTSSSLNEILQELSDFLPPSFMERLEAYVNSTADLFLIADIEEHLALMYFEERLLVDLSYDQASVLLCKSVQHKDLSFMEKEMKLGRQQILSLFMKIMKKIYKYLHGLEPAPCLSKQDLPLRPLDISMDDYLDDAAKQVEGLFGPELLLQQYAIVDKNTDFENALCGIGGRVSASGIISVKSSKDKFNKIKGKGKRKSGKNQHKATKKWKA